MARWSGGVGDPGEARHGGPRALLAEDPAGEAEPRATSETGGGVDASQPVIGIRRCRSRNCLELTLCGRPCQQREESQFKLRALVERESHQGVPPDREIPTADVVVLSLRNVPQYVRTVSGEPTRQMKAPLPFGPAYRPVIHSTLRYTTTIPLKEYPPPENTSESSLWK